MTNTFARVLAKVVTSRVGLIHLTLPRHISQDFISEMIEAADIEAKKIIDVDQYAWHVSKNYRTEDKHTVSPEYAAALRSRTDGPASALIISKEGDFRELASLEPFQHINPDFLPNGAVGITSAAFALASISEKLASHIILELREQDKIEISKESTEVLTKTIEKVLHYLVEAYKSYGNADISWKEGWWLHLIFAASRLKKAMLAKYSTTKNCFEDKSWASISVFNAFGVPKGDENSQSIYKVENSPSKYAEIIQNKWQDGESASLAIVDMACDAIKHKTIEKIADYKLMKLEWDAEYEMTVAIEKHPMLALSKHRCIDIDDHVKAWDAVTEEQFFDSKAIDTNLKVCRVGSDGKAQSLPTIPTDIYIVWSDAPSFTDDMKFIDYGEFFLEFDTETSCFEAQDFKIKAAPKNLELECLSVESGSGVTRLKVTLKLKLPSAGKTIKWREAPFNVTINPVHNELTVLFSEPKKLQLLFPMPCEQSFYILSKGEKKGIQTNKYEPLTQLIYSVSNVTNFEVIHEARTLNIAGRHKADIVIIGTDVKLKLDEENASFDTDKDHHYFHTMSDVALADEMKIVSGDKELQINIDEKDNRALSPIITAALGVYPGDHEDGSVQSQLEEDPRGQLERKWLPDFFKADIERDPDDIGQLIMVTDGKSETDDPFFDDESKFWVLGEKQGEGVRTKTVVSYPRNLIADFWASFHKLGLNDLAKTASGITGSWPSRLRLVDLQKEDLVAYLEKYQALVDIVEEDPSLAWLLYPFSVIIYNKSNDDIAGVLLSPLHPIRLAWAWSIQKSADDAFRMLSDKGVDVTKLLRFINGHDLPGSGPAPKGAHTLFSVPLASGRDDIFIVWSFLVRGEDKIPDKISGYKFPIGTSSGLDKGGIAAGLNDYLRIHPYINELRLGLFSQTLISRSTELDTAIVDELGAILKKDTHNLPGGIKVYDSAKRRGPLPSKELILGKIREAMSSINIDQETKPYSFPFEWHVDDEKHVDVRFLENSLVKPFREFSTEVDSASGILPPLPVTRYSISTSDNPAGEMESTVIPLVGKSNNKNDLSIFSDILNKLEAWQGKTLKIRSTINRGAAITGENFNWVIAGNAHLDPHLLSDSLNDMPGSSEKVLWEWRPPYLPRRWQAASPSIMATSPYTVIAKISSDFKKQLQKELDKILGKSCVDFSDLFKVLGSRGVGIASLLSMGHQQSRGAIGFYFGFELASQWEDLARENEIRFALPLDAVNPIFEALAGVKIEQDNRKKADLLLMSAVFDNEAKVKITLTPVEIKMHAADQSVHDFPAPDKKSVKSATSQLDNTKKVLERFVNVLEKSERTILLDTAIASIIETGFSLSNSKATTSQKRMLLASVVSGNCDFMLDDNPILLWFDSKGKAANGEHFSIRRPTEKLPYLYAFIDPEKCLDDIKGKNKLGLQNALWPKVKKSKIVCRPSEGGQKATIPDNESDNSGSLNGEGTVTPGKLSKLVLHERHKKIVAVLNERNIFCSTPAKDILPFVEGPANVVYKIKLNKTIRPEKIDSEKGSLKLQLELDEKHHISTNIGGGHVLIDVPKLDSERYFVDAKKDLWEKWRRPSNDLSVPIGINQTGEIVDLNFSASNTPHLLIGGTTGSGKSEALNTILAGLVRYYSSEELRLFLVDGKGTDLLIFEDSDHLHGEIGDTDDDAIGQLTELVNEMNDRYDKFKAKRLRDLKSYNRSVDPADRLPWVVIVLDEYADLTSDSDKKKIIEALLKRVAQKGRASGVHVIIATQKPSGTVISTDLRSNLPAQLALQVRSSTESRVIMDAGGAESLNGKGDAFLNSAGTLTRVQCAMVSEES